MTSNASRTRTLFAVDLSRTRRTRRFIYFALLFSPKQTVFFLYVRKTLSRRRRCCYLQYIGRPAYLLLHIMHIHTHTYCRTIADNGCARRGVIGYMVSHSGRFKFERRADRRGLTLLSTSRPVFFRVPENAPAFQELVRLIY
ncbi:unnamed protein product [Aphis gossypii]|uniref:Uncharacterized protein n=1 Tax=Aphis gossypii TaxID=80765 RepID=A0A9P0NEQ0_APHGO|nr:unnamed protein product [Aphis gossypii]